MGIHSGKTTLRFAVGDIAITKVVELVEHASPSVLYVDRVPDDFDPHLDWLQPNYVDAEKSMLLSVHSFVLKTAHHTILVDTCVGNHKQGNSRFPNWNGREGPFLDDLTAAGFAPEDVDFVLCTHMHSDHTGWNTRLQDGRWVPTFPNAKYVMARSEVDHVRIGAGSQYNESILPVIESGQAVLVDTDHALDDEIRLEPTPGHTPGHVAVVLASGGREAVMCGDLMHSPIQCRFPDWRYRIDSDHAEANRTRRRFLEANCETDRLVLTAHFPSPSMGHVVADGDAFGFRFL